MKQSNKKILAKEIIIFFSAVVIIGLILITVEVVNQIRSNNVEKLQKQIAHLSNECDSISSLNWPKPLSLEKMIVGEIPSKYYEIQNLDNRVIDSSKVAEVQIKKLYNLLLVLNYPFKGDSHWIPSEVFVDNIKNEFKNLYKDRIELNKICKYLRDKKLIDIEDWLFVLNLEGQSLPSSFSQLVEGSNYVTRIQKLESDIKNSNNILSESEMNSIMIFTCIFAIVIIYPFRFIVICIMWAIKQLKEN